MERHVVSRDELVRCVNGRVRELAKVDACAIAGVLRLHKPDDDGCNWQEVGIVKAIHKDGFRHALREIRAQYNLEDEA